MPSRLVGPLMAVAVLGVNLEAEPPDLVVSGAVQVPWIGTAEWTIGIDPEGNVTGADRVAACRVTSDERSELTRLVSALPTGRAEYRFGNRGPATDVRRKVTMVVRRSGQLRSYTYWQCDEKPCPYQTQKDAIDRLWRFLRGLCQPRDTNEPGPTAKP